MDPKQLENFVLRMTGNDNKIGPAAHALKQRFGLEGFGDPNVFDCDDRAEIAIRELKKRGYEGKTKIQRSVAGRVAHRYVSFADDKGEHHIMRKPDDY